MDEIGAPRATIHVAGCGQDAPTHASFCCVHMRILPSSIIVAPSLTYKHTSVISPKREKTSVRVMSSASCGSIPTNSLFSRSTGATRPLGPIIYHISYHVSHVQSYRVVSNNVMSCHVHYCHVMSCHPCEQRGMDHKLTRRHGIL